MINAEIKNEYPTNFKEKFFYHFEIYKAARDLLNRVEHFEEKKFYFLKTLMELF